MREEGSNVFEVPARYWPAVEAKLAKLQRRASKLDQAELSVDTERFTRQETVGRTLDGKEIVIDRPWLRVAVHGVAPSLPGYTLVGTIVHYPEGLNVFRCAPGEKIPESYREACPRCDHCGTLRNRKDTFLLRDMDGILMQIGRNCLKDFMPEKDAVAIAAYLDWIGRIAACIEEGASGGDGSPQWQKEDMLDYLAAVAAAIRVDGWTSRGKARDEDITATADWAWSVLRPSPRQANDPRHPKVTPDDVLVAQTALAWVRELPETERSEDYLANLYAVCTRDWFGPREDGLVASLVGAAYPRAMRDREDTKRKEEAAATSGHVGELKQRLRGIPVTIERVRGWEGDFGWTTLVAMRDDAGNLLVWYASGEPDVPDEGTEAILTGTVKRHGNDRYTGECATYVNRCLVQTVQDMSA